MVMKNVLESMVMVATNVRYYPTIYLDRLREIIKTSVRTASSGWYSNFGPPKYKARGLTSTFRHLSCIIFLVYHYIFQEAIKYFITHNRHSMFIIIGIVGRGYGYI
jgi:hypothetical protein